MTRAGKLIDHTCAARSIRRLCPTAQVPEEKSPVPAQNVPAIREDIEHNAALLVEQAQDRLLEEKQLMVGWDR